MVSSASCIELCRVLFLRWPRVTTPGKYLGSLPEMWTSRAAAPSACHGNASAARADAARTGRVVVELLLCCNICEEEGEVG